ncbi:heme-copper oxidase subunit III [Synechocystis sp. LKSZ1]|uniref:cytochrome c oxidase subunit 3 n=1 Tax=Synechocystis sp. LKSZ1 TaxID=3144951 RepID=UPI00336C2695
MVNPSSPEEKNHLGFGFPVFLLSESIVFISFFITYAILRLKTPQWFPTGVTGLDIPRAAINTIILVVSSGAVILAEQALERHQVVLFRRLWLLTATLGIIFLFGQAAEWQAMPFSLDAGPAGATFYLLTGFHGLHVLTGVLLLLYIYRRSLNPRNFRRGHAGVTAVALFWHFVDGIWLVLFALLYLWPAGAIYSP